MSDSESVIALPSGPLTKKEWALILRNHFKSEPLFGMKPWEQTFEKLVKHSKFKEDPAGSEKYSLVAGLEERNVLQALREVQVASLTGVLKKLME